MKDEHEGKVNEHAKMLSEHNDRLVNIEKRLGIKSSKKEAMGQDQKGKNRNPLQDEKEPIYGRKRHA